MRLKLTLAASALTLAFASAGVASAQSPTPAKIEKPVVIAGGLSDAARATAVTDASGKPVGTSAYKKPVDAVKAGDMAAYLTMLQAKQAAGEEIGPMPIMYLALDKAAAGNSDGARAVLKAAETDAVIAADSRMYAYVDAWLLAMDGQPDAAIQRHRDAKGGLPGLVGDLSLAGMLEALGRPDQALAVYESLTPTRIEAPEHDFDPKGLVYSHVKTVISRRTLLLQRLGRIDEAKAVYQKLADSEPEHAASYAAAMESIETGENLDNDALTVRGAFVQSLSDLSRASQEQRIIGMIMRGKRPSGFDDQRSSFDQVALLIHPEDDGLRSAIIDLMYENALYDGVAHIALSAPETTSTLQIAAAQAFIMSDQADKGRAAIDKALKVSTDEERMQTLYGALQLRTLLDDRKEAIALVDRVKKEASNTAEKASAHGLASNIYSQFGELKKAAKEARKARNLDDTHDRRMTLADALGKSGDINGALKILRSERLSRPDDPYTLNSLGYFLLIHTDKYEEAYKVLHVANALAQNDAYIADSYGWARFKLGDLAGALRLIEFSRAELAPHAHWEIEDHLGDIYWHKGRKEDAKKAWAIALENRPPDREKALIADKLANGISGPPPAVQPLPNVSLEDTEIDRRDI
jgi:tetratricopeptide (TPR) repeat protein